VADPDKLIVAAEGRIKPDKLLEDVQSHIHHHP
jgi:hypothetical protein